jgi:hypothetical protein
MLHFTCDSCGESIAENRFVVRLEVYPAHQPSCLSEEDLQPDHLQALAEELSSQADAENEFEPPRTQSFRYDLCPRCHARYVQDPLRVAATKRLNFSEN